MKNYWDHTEKERSEMTKEQVQEFLDIELMEKGCIKPVSPVLRAVEKVNISQETYYNVHNIYFKTIEQAKSFLELNPLQTDYDTAMGYDYKYVRNYDTYNGGIQSVTFYKKEDLQRLRSVLVSNNDADEFNSSATSKFDKDSKKVEEVVSGIWSDWHSCGSTRKNLQNILDTREEYLRMTGGDAVLARTFLLKAYDGDYIKKCEDWFGIKDESELQ